MSYCNIFYLLADDGFNSVPVIAVFTKFDALWDDAYGQLKESGLTRMECQRMAPEKAKEIFTSMKIWDRLRETQYPPKHWVYLAGMLTLHFMCIVYNLHDFRNGQG
jgi:hypothetical protein